jgi:hypothetical protein
MGQYVGTSGSSSCRRSQQVRTASSISPLCCCHGWLRYVMAACCYHQEQTEHWGLWCSAVCCWGDWCRAGRCHLDCPWFVHWRWRSDSAGHRSHLCWGRASSWSACWALGTTCWSSADAAWTSLPHAQGTCPSDTHATRTPYDHMIRTVRMMPLSIRQARLLLACCCAVKSMPRELLRAQRSSTRGRSRRTGVDRPE